MQSKEIPDELIDQLLAGGSRAFAPAASATARHSPEHPRAQREPAPPSLHVLLADPTDAAIETAYRHGYTLRQIATHLGGRSATISRRLRDRRNGHPQRLRRTRHPR